MMGDDVGRPEAVTGQRLPHSVRESLAHPPLHVVDFEKKKKKNILRNLSFIKQQLEVFGRFFFVVVFFFCFN